MLAAFCVRSECARGAMCEKNKERAKFRYFFWLFKIEAFRYDARMIFEKGNETREKQIEPELNAQTH